MTNLFVNRLTTTSKLPYKKYESDAGFDLSCDENFEIKPWDKILVHTGIAFTVPEGTYGQIAPRSSVSMKGVFVNAGVIDRTYTGEVRILLFNMTNDVIRFTQGDRIAQLIIKKIDSPTIIECNDLNTTERGSGGFGSTGDR